MAHVTVDDEHLATFDCQRHTEVDSEERLTGTGVERCDGYHVGFILVDLHELEVGAEHAEGFVDDIAAAILDNDGAGELAATEFLLFAVLAIEGYFAKEGNGEVLEVLATAHFSVKHFHYVSYSERQ